MTAPLTRFGHFGWPVANLPSLFDDLFGGSSWPRSFGNGAALGLEFPALNVWDAGEALHVEAELPGFSLDDVELTLHGGTLTLKGTRQEVREEQAAWLRRERAYGEFTRSVRLPFEIEADKVEARLDNGVLSIVLPKAEAHRPRKISVSGA